MRVKKFVAGDMRSALQKVREELGPDAVILKTASVKPSGLFGFFRSKVIEVTAAADVPASKKADTASLPPAPNASQATASRTSTTKTSTFTPSAASAGTSRLDVTVSDEGAAAPSLQSFTATSTASTATNPGAPASSHAGETATPEKAPKAAGAPEFKPVSRPEEPANGERFTKLEQELSLLKHSIDLLLEREGGGAQPEVPEKLKPYFDPLIKTEVDPDLARRIAEMLSRGASHSEDATDVAPAPEERLVEELETRLLSAEPTEIVDGERKVIVLVGPTGVGKTTTLAKIAAQFIHEERKIVFLTADTYRIAAVEQLQKYADIMGVEMEAAYTPAELSEALERHEDADLVFVDTAGRSPHNKSQMEEMVAFVEACLPAEVHLVLSVNVKQRDLHDASQLFSSAPINRLIFTKLDESKTCGSILNIVDEFQLPISFITTGQNVPEDIEPAAARQLAERMVYGQAIESSVEEESALS